MKRLSTKWEAPQRHRTGKEKAEILKEYQGSGHSLLGFARKRGLCYASLLRWRSRQRKGGKALVLPASEGDPRFVPVKIEREVLSCDYVLSWAGGRSLKIPLQFETDSLRRLLTVLEEAG